MEVPICGIYKITSPSGKIYIGQALDIIKRWSRYINMNCKAQPHLYNSLVKYGHNNHSFEIVHICEVHTAEVLNELEKYYILKFDCFNSANGMNLRSGGGRGGMLSEESKIKSGKSLKLNWIKRKQDGTDKQSKETVNKRITSYKATLERKKMEGKSVRHSEESKRLRSIKSKEYQAKIKQNPQYYSDEQIQKRRDSARKGYLTQVKNGTTRNNKGRVGLYGKDNPFFGKKHTQETLDKIAKKRKITWKNKIASGWKQSESHIAKRVKKQVGRKRTKDQKENIKQGMTIRKLNGYYEKNKEKLSMIQKEAWIKKKDSFYYSDEEKSKRSAIAKKRWAITGKTKNKK